MHNEVLHRLSQLQQPRRPLCLLLGGDAVARGAAGSKEIQPQIEESVVKPLPTRTPFQTILREPTKLREIASGYRVPRDYTLKSQVIEPVFLDKDRKISVLNIPEETKDFDSVVGLLNTEGWPHNLAVTADYTYRNGKITHESGMDRPVSILCF